MAIGYIVRLFSNKSPTKSLCSIYTEPHCMYDESQLSRYSPIDYVITPIASQKLGLSPGNTFYTLVDGGSKALKLGQILKCKGILPMANGELEQTGLLSKIVQSEGSETEFRKITGKDIKVYNVTPGIPITL